MWVDHLKKNENSVKIESNLMASKTLSLSTFFFVAFVSFFIDWSFFILKNSRLHYILWFRNRIPLHTKTISKENTHETIEIGVSIR